MRRERLLSYSTRPELSSWLPSAASAGRARALRCDVTLKARYHLALASWLKYL